MKEKLKQANELLKIQGTKGTLHYNDYMTGMYNGMELIIAIFEDREPSFEECKDSSLAESLTILKRRTE